MPSKSKLEFRLLGKDDAEAFRDLRLSALKAHPESFLGSYDIESAQPLTYFAEAIFKDKMIGAFKDDRLLGIAGYYVMTPGGKRAHTAKLWGFYVHPEYRGRGFARKLLARVLDEAEKDVEKVLLKVHAQNKRAVKLYRAMGFEEYGRENKSLKIDGKYYDDRLMSKFL